MPALSFPHSLKCLAEVVAICCWLALAPSHVGVARASADAFEPFTFVVFGDPQIGFGPGGIYADSQRFDRVIEHANELHAPVAVIPGDFVQRESMWQSWAFSRSVRRIEGRLLLTPGNHDVDDSDALADYRAAFGADYHDFVYKNCAFVLVNSETARNADLSIREYEEQWAWLESTLQAHAQAGRKHVFLITHRPPFARSERERESGSNWPLPQRQRLLDFARRYGVRWIISGHLHRMVMTDTMDAIAVVALPGTARSYDHSPLGYGLFRVGPEKVDFEFVEVGPGPSAPASIPGFREWTPRLFDFSPRHWLFTLAFAAAGAFALRARRRFGHADSASGRRSAAGLWLTVAVLMFFHGANMQLDLDEFLREVGRGMAKLTGLHSMRHWVTGTGLVVLVLGATVMAVRNRPRSRKEFPAALALLATIPPTLWFALSTISHHSLGMLFDESVWDVLNLLAAATVIFTARRTIGASAIPRAHEANAA